MRGRLADAYMHSPAERDLAPSPPPARVANLMIEDPMSEDAVPQLSLLEELDARQDEALLQLNELNSRVETLIADFMRVRASEGEAA
jgi:hypothetical protein